MKITFDAQYIYDLAIQEAKKLEKFKNIENLQATEEVDDRLNFIGITVYAPEDK